MPQIYRCDATKLILYGQILSYNEFLFFSRNVEILHLDYSRVKNPNVTVATNPESTIVPLEKLVKTLVKLKKIMGKNNPTHSFITKNTARELSENPNFSNIYEMTLYRIPEKNKYTKFQLHFAGSISEEHKVRLEKIVDEILQTKYHDYKPPLITFDGLAAEKLCKLQDLFNDIRFSY
uniref:Uncharacterized protein n=1 Tax=Panagrolaimus sp. PS1159 TaxID=55785 RepID=A0AC35FXP3_9BILA